MRKLALIVVVALAPSLGACAQTQKLLNAVSVITSAHVPVGDVVAADKAFNAMQGIADAYISLPRCDGSTAACRKPAITKQVIAAVRKGRIARNNLVAFARAHPGEIGAQGAYDALNASIDTIRNLIAQNAGALK